MLFKLLNPFTYAGQMLEMLISKTHCCVTSNIALYEATVDDQKIV